MMEQKPVVLTTLSDKGYVESTKTVLARLLGYYIATDGEQSFCFHKEIISLPKTYHQFINDPSGFADAVETDISNLLGAYYKNVEVETEVRFDKTGSKADIGLYASVIDSTGRKVGLGKVVEIDPTGLKNIIDVNNFGEAMRLIQR